MGYQSGLPPYRHSAGVSPGKPPAAGIEPRYPPTLLDDSSPYDLGFANLWALSWSLFAKGIGKLLLIAAIVEIPSGILLGLLFFHESRQSVVIISVLAMIFLWIWELAASVRMFSRELVGKPSGVWQALKGSWPRCPQAVLAVISIFIFYFIVSWIYKVLLSLLGPGISNIIWLAGFFYLTTLYMTAIHAVVVEKVNGWRAMDRSCRLTGGQRWVGLLSLVVVTSSTGLVSWVIDLATNSTGLSHGKQAIAEIIALFFLLWIFKTVMFAWSLSLATVMYFRGRRLEMAKQGLKI